MDLIKEAFQKVKQDMALLVHEIEELKKEIVQIKDKIDEKNIKKLSKVPTQNSKIPALPTQTPTHNYQFKPSRPQNIGISTGNAGVPTDKQTNRQTNRHTMISHGNSERQGENMLADPIHEAARILDSLDSIKKELRLKFKRLTEKEMILFSAIYEMEEEKGYADYRGLSTRLGLSESSIRDYTGRLIKKGIPVLKNKINNKYIQLLISPDLKKVATLSTIIQLRGI